MINNLFSRTPQHEHADAAKSKARALAGIDVITRDVETAPAQTLRYRAAHEVQANHADMPHSPDSL